MTIVVTKNYSHFIPINPKFLSGLDDQIHYHEPYSRGFTLGDLYLYSKIKFKLKDYFLLLLREYGMFCERVRAIQIEEITY